MKKINIIIERGEDAYAAYAEKFAGIYAMASSVEEVKESIKTAILLYNKHNKSKTPILLNTNYTLEYTYDIQSFFNFYKGVFTKSGLEKITGINQKQIQHYSSGLKKPRSLQRKKIQDALHKLGAELQSIHL